MRPSTPILACAILSFGCRSTPGAAPPPPIPGAIPADHLILPGEDHFAHLWKLTSGGENAEAYWSFAGDRLSMQARDTSVGIECDRIYVSTSDGWEQVSNGRGVTTCSYFLPGDQDVLFASTQAAHETCPPPPDRSRGYVWAIHPEYDVYVRELETGEERVLIGGPGYDAEATVSPVGDRIVFTSTRSGDLELWTCDLDGSNVSQVTDQLGYDGGAFFSHDGAMLVFRSTRFPDEDPDAARAEYRQLLEDGLVRPSAMELVVIGADGTGRRQLTDLGNASFAPSFFPDDERVIFATNHHNESRNFDLFAIDLDGSNLEQITSYDDGGYRSFDGFPLFSPDGRYLAFSSNRGGSEAGETNVFIAEWRP